MSRVISRENAAMLRELYANLTKAGEASIVAARNFGQMVDLLKSMGYSYSAIGRVVGRTTSAVSVYAKLFRSYPTEAAMIRQARELGTYDVARLAGANPLVPVRYEFVCTNCGSHDFIRERKEPAVYVVPPAVRAS